MWPRGGGARAARSQQVPSGAWSPSSRVPGAPRKEVLCSRKLSCVGAPGVLGMHNAENKGRKSQKERRRSSESSPNLLAGESPAWVKSLPTPKLSVGVRSQSGTSQESVNRGLHTNLRHQEPRAICRSRSDAEPFPTVGDASPSGANTRLCSHTGRITAVAAQTDCGVRFCYSNTCFLHAHPGQRCLSLF